MINSKFETRNSKQIRNPEIQISNKNSCLKTIRTSNFEFASDFDFRISDLSNANIAFLFLFIFCLATSGLAEEASPKDPKPSGQVEEVPQQGLEKSPQAFDLAALKAEIQKIRESTESARTFLHWLEREDVDKEVLVQESKKLERWFEEEKAWLEGGEISDTLTPLKKSLIETCQYYLWISTTMVEWGSATIPDDASRARRRAFELNETGAYRMAASIDLVNQLLAEEARKRLEEKMAEEKKKTEEVK